MTRKRLMDVVRKNAAGQPKPDTLTDLLVAFARTVEDFAKDNGRALIKQGDVFLKELILATDQTHYILQRVFRQMRVEDNLRIDPKDVRFLENLGAAKWRELIELSFKYVQTYIWPRKALSRRGAINALKGFIAERLFYITRTYDDEFAGAVTRAKALAKELGIPEGAVNLRRYDDVWARTVTGDGKVTMEALGDGVLAFEHDGVLHVMTVFEMKSPSNRRDLLEGAVDEIDRIRAAGVDAWGQVGPLKAREGQISRDFERFREATLVIEGVTRLDDTVSVSRNVTHFVGVMPKGKPLDVDDVDRIREVYKNFRQVEQTVSNDVIRALAKELLRILSGK